MMIFRWPCLRTGGPLGPALLALVSVVLLGGCATGYPPGSLLNGAGQGSAGGFPGQVAGAGRGAGCLEEAARPPGWPHLSSSQEVLAPFLACATPAEFIELQRGVDMAWLVEQLDDWSAVRLGALGPLRAGTHVLNRKRASFLVTATGEYGAARAEPFALYLLHSAFDDDVREVLGLLAGDKQLAVFEETPESLTDIDFHFWSTDFFRIFERERIEEHAVPAVAAYLGEVLVRNLGGQWIPRKKYGEMQVRVGSRVWFPYVRAHRYLRSRQSLLERSLTQLYRAAELHRS